MVLPKKCVTDFFKGLCFVVCNSAVRNAWSATIENQVTRTLKSLTKKSRWCAFSFDKISSWSTRDCGVWMCGSKQGVVKRGLRGARALQYLDRTTKISALSSSIKVCINCSWCPGKSMIFYLSDPLICDWLWPPLATNNTNTRDRKSTHFFVVWKIIPRTNQQLKVMLCVCAFSYRICLSKKIVFWRRMETNNSISYRGRCKCLFLCHFCANVCHCHKLTSGFWIKGQDGKNLCN